MRVDDDAARVIVGTCSLGDRDGLAFIESLAERNAVFERIFAVEFTVFFFDLRSRHRLSYACPARRDHHDGRAGHDS
jgi:hypothetical protein